MASDSEILENKQRGRRWRERESCGARCPFLSLSHSHSFSLQSSILFFLLYQWPMEKEMKDGEREREKDSRGTCLHHCPPPSLCSLLCEELEGCRRADAKSDQRRNLSGRNAFVGPLRDEEIEASTSFSLFSFFLFSDWLNWIQGIYRGLEMRICSDGYAIYAPPH